MYRRIYDTTAYETIKRQQKCALKTCFQTYETDKRKNYGKRRSINVPDREKIHVNKILIKVLYIKIRINMIRENTLYIVVARYLFRWQ